LQHVATGRFGCAAYQWMMRSGGSRLQAASGVDWWTTGVAPQQRGCL